MAKVPRKSSGSAGGRTPPEGSPSRPASEGGSGADAPRGEAACSLVNVTYLTGVDEKNKKIKTSIGRSWGVFNRGNLPLGERTLVSLPAGHWLDKAKAEARKVWPGVDGYPGCGFMLFVPDASQWSALMCGLQAEEVTEKQPAKVEPGVPF